MQQIVYLALAFGSASAFVAPAAQAAGAWGDSSDAPTVVIEGVGTLRLDPRATRWERIRRARSRGKNRRTEFWASPKNSLRRFSDSLRARGIRSAGFEFPSGAVVPSE